MRDDIEFNIQFCEEFEKYPCLCDYSRSDYCNRSAQDQAWQKIAKKFGVQATECKERWKNVRERYTKYKKQFKLPSGSGAKKNKEYYLASHLQFLDSFLRSRQSKGNIITEENPTQEEPRDKTRQEDENQDGAMDEFHETASSEQDTSNPLPDNMPNTPSTAMPPPPPQPNRDSNFRNKRKSSTLDDVNSSACKYFEAKQQMLERRQQSTATSQPDPDMAFLQSILPDMKAMDDRQKLCFKRGILNLTEQIRYAQPLHKAGSSMNTQSKSPLMNILSRDSSINTLSRESSKQTIECASPKPIDDDATGGDQFFNRQEQIEQEENFNMARYLSFLPNSGSLPQN